MRRHVSISVLLQAVTGLMALTLVATFAVLAGEAFQLSRTAEHVRVIADISRDLFVAMENLRVERGTVNTALETQKPVDAATLATVAELRSRSDQALNSALGKLAGVALDKTDAALAEIRDDRARLSTLRVQADATLLKPRDQRSPALSAKWVAGEGKLVDDIDALSDVLSGQIVEADPFIAAMIKIKQLGWTVRDAAGTDRLLVGAAIAKAKGFPGETRDRTLALTGRMDAAWKIITDGARLQPFPASLRDAIAQAQQVYFGEVRDKRATAITELVAGKKPSLSGAEWVTLSNRGLESLIAVVDTAFDVTESHAAAESAAARRRFIVAGTLMLCFLGFGVFAVLLVSRRIAQPMAQITASVRAVAGGDLGSDIPFAARGDEVGELARALAVFRDNALAKQRMEDELLRKERLSALGQLTATVAHELRNPLSAIRNAAYLLAEVAPGKDAFERPIARIERSVARCDRIIADLLGFTRVRALTRNQVAADAWLDDVLGEQKLPDGIALVRRFGAPGSQIPLDGDRMRQVIVNLVENAVQALANSVAADPQIVIATRPAGAFLEIAIEDNGPGISAAILNKVFEPLFTTKASGTGLGLPTVKQIVEQHGGTVTVTSEIGKGTRVIIALPLRIEAEVAA